MRDASWHDSRFPPSPVVTLVVELEGAALENFLTVLERFGLVIPKY